MVIDRSVKERSDPVRARRRRDFPRSNDCRISRRRAVCQARGRRQTTLAGPAHRAIALDETEMATLESYGRPAFLIVPNDHHRLDAKAWKERYPQLQVVVAPEGAREKVAEVVPVDTATPSFDDPQVLFVTVPGTRENEAALVVRGPGGTTLVLNDLVGNIRNESGFGGWFLRLMGFAGDAPGLARAGALSEVGSAAPQMTPPSRSASKRAALTPSQSR
jgi:hypothetical protein